MAIVYFIVFSNFRAVFNWVSKVIRVLLRFCFTSLCDWLKNLAPLSRPIRSKTQTNQSWLARARTLFPALDAGYMYLLPVLIGSLGNLCLLWLAGVITLVLVLWHSFEKRSIHTHCFKGLYFPVKAFNTSWPTIPPREAARGAKQPRDVNANWDNNFSSRWSAYKK